MSDLFAHPWRDPGLAAKLTEHANACYPEEACAVVTHSGAMIPLKNQSPQPTGGFDCWREFAEYYDEGMVAAFVHSHPDGPDHPSVYDMRQQIEMDIPWGLINLTEHTSDPVWFWGEQIEPPPLLGRDFRWGPSGTDGKGDCAALIRDYHRIEYGRHLPEFPRSKGWETTDLSYPQALLDAGFVQISAAEPQPGDVFLASVRDEHNHAGVFIGRERILHHMQGRLSTEEPLIGWLRFVRYWFRYNDVVESKPLPGNVLTLPHV